jgi:hypothetical protein
MRKTVEFECLEMKSAEVWMVTSYKSDGLYLVKDEFNTSSFIQVFNNCVYGTVLAPNFSPETSEVTELTVQKESTQRDSITGDTLLRALAIAQDPQLAKDLLK